MITHTGALTPSSTCAKPLPTLLVRLGMVSPISKACQYAAWQGETAMALLAAVTEPAAAADHVKV